MSARAQRFVRRLLTSDAGRRPSAREALDDPWLAGEATRRCSEDAVPRAEPVAGAPATPCLEDALLDANGSKWDAGDRNRDARKLAAMQATADDESDALTLAVMRATALTSAGVFPSLPAREVDELAENFMEAWTDRDSRVREVLQAAAADTASRYVVPIHASCVMPFSFSKLTPFFPSQESSIASGRCKISGGIIEVPRAKLRKYPELLDC